jgi:hypothetical protein
MRRHGVEPTAELSRGRLDALFYGRFPIRSTTQRITSFEHVTAF